MTTDSVYSIPVTVSGQEFTTFICCYDLIILMDFEHYFGVKGHSSIPFHHSILDSPYVVAIFHSLHYILQASLGVFLYHRVTVSSCLHGLLPLPCPDFGHDWEYSFMEYVSTFSALQEGLSRVGEDAWYNT